MADKISSITDLPLDILVLVFPYLDAKSFLALCSTCKAFQQPSIQLDPAYWSYLARTTFRVPNQPVVQHDGDRWQKMYRRMLTQSRVYTWGHNSHNRLGHALDPEDHTHGRRGPRMRAGMMRPGRRMYAAHQAFPTEMDKTRDLGVIADMQCGGWSTTLLTSKGTLHTAGVLDGQRILLANGPLQPLRFPEGYPPTATDAQYEEPTVAIRQFSSGRAHILGLSDSGRMWSWYDVKKPALQVKFATLQLNEISLNDTTRTTSNFGQIKQVVAGWSRSSAYVHGIGIVVWDPVERDHGEDGTDTMLVLEHAEVPQTGYQHVKGTRESDEQRALGREVGAVLNYVLLEHFVLFTTDLGKVFCGKFGAKNQVEDVIELRMVRHEKGAPLDVQGSFRNFAIFKDNEVITGDQNYLESCWSHRHNSSGDMQGLKKIPALQGTNVISIAFGDYHYLALHSNGKITSYGTENGGCGSLGLGMNDDNLVGKARGIVYDQFNNNGQLLPHAYTTGRQIWFDARKNEWLKEVVHDQAHAEESASRRELFLSDHNVQGEVSEWFEQEGRARDQDGGEDGLGAYFALQVSAAGWQSGALVLVNEKLAKKEPTNNREDRSFPRLKLSDGREMPGEKDFDEWREGRPDFQLNA